MAFQQEILCPAPHRFRANSRFPCARQNQGRHAGRRQGEAVECIQPLAVRQAQIGKYRPDSFPVKPFHALGKRPNPLGLKWAIRRHKHRLLKGFHVSGIVVNEQHSADLAQGLVLE